MVYVGSEKQRTEKHSGGGKNPRWNATLQFQTRDPILRIEVYDDDFGKDDLLGAGTVNLNQCYQNPNRTENGNSFFIQSTSIFSRTAKVLEELSFLLSIKDPLSRAAGEASSKAVGDKDNSKAAGEASNKAVGDKEASNKEDGEASRVDKVDGDNRVGSKEDGASMVDSRVAGEASKADNKEDGASRVDNKVDGEDKVDSRVDGEETRGAGDYVRMSFRQRYHLLFLNEILSFLISNSAMKSVKLCLKRVRASVWSLSKFTQISTLNKKLLCVDDLAEMKRKPLMRSCPSNFSPIK